VKEITKELKKIENCLDFWGGICLKAEKAKIIGTDKIKTHIGIEKK